MFKSVKLICHVQNPHGVNYHTYLTYKSLYIVYILYHSTFKVNFHIFYGIKQLKIIQLR